MTDKHLETKYEAEMVAHLVEEGWVEGDPAEYDRKLALYPEDLIGWLKETQAEEWAKLAAFHNGDTEQLLLQRVVTLMDKEGSLALLRHGFKHGNARFQLCQFKPGHHFNPETLARYKKDQGLNFTLLSDFNKEVSATYGSLYEKFGYNMRGVSKRSAFVIDKEGIIRYTEVLDNAGEVPNFERITAVLRGLL